MPAPTVTSIAPDQGLNTAAITAGTIVGTGMIAGVTAKLTKAGQSDITIAVTRVSDTELTITNLPISGATAGRWLLVITTSGGSSAEAVYFQVLRDSIRERIVKDVKSTLEGITKANGYHVDMKYVDRDEETALTRTSEFPNCFLAEAGEEAVQRPLNYWLKTLSLQISVAVQRKGELSTELNRTMADIEQALMTTPSRSTLAIDTVLKRSVQLVSAVGDPVGVAVIDIEINYRHDIGNPNTLTGL